MSGRESVTNESAQTAHAAEPSLASEPRPPKSRVREGLSVTLLMIYTAIVLAVTMWPTPVDAGYQGTIDRVLAMLHRNGVPEWFRYGELEFSANIVMFIPLGFLLGLALPRAVSWLALLLIPAFSMGIEWTQANFLEARFATIQDVIANTGGGWFGVLLAFIIRAMVYSRDEKVIARAAWDAKYGARHN